MTISLNDPSLRRGAALVVGRRTAVEGKGVAVGEPSTGHVIGQPPDLGVDETAEAIGAARLARTAWPACIAKDRSAELRRLFDLVMAKQDDPGRIMTAEARFVGVTSSGPGRAAWRQGLDDFLELKYFCLEGIE